MIQKSCLILSKHVQKESRRNKNEFFHCDGVCHATSAHTRMCDNTYNMARLKLVGSRLSPQLDVSRNIKYGIFTIYKMGYMDTDFHKFRPNFSYSYVIDGQIYSRYFNFSGQRNLLQLNRYIYGCSVQQFKLGIRSGSLHF